MRQSGCGLTAAALIAGMERLGLMNALAQTNDYKALVCIFLFGGNDSDNVIVPYETTGVRRGCGTARPRFQIPHTSLLQFQAGGSGAGAAVRVSPEPDRAARTCGRGQGLAVCNVGPLSGRQPRQDYLNRRIGGRRISSRTPISRRSGRPRWRTRRWPPAGAAGRRIRHARSESGRRSLPDDDYRLGPDAVQHRADQRPLALSPGAAFRLEGFPSRRTPIPVIRRCRSFYRRIAKRSWYGARRSRFIRRSRTAPAGQSPHRRPLPQYFARRPIQAGGADDQVERQASSLGLNRQLFFCSLGGFDTHNGQVTNANPVAGNHANLSLQVSAAMKAFYDEKIAQGIQSSVTTFTLSDFGRTFRPNGTARHRSRMGIAPVHDGRRRRRRRLLRNVPHARSQRTERNRFGKQRPRQMDPDYRGRSVRRDAGGVVRRKAADLAAVFSNRYRFVRFPGSPGIRVARRPNQHPDAKAQRNRYA